MNFKYIVLVIVSAISFNGCAKKRTLPSVREPTQELINSFATVETTEPAPLEIVTPPVRDEPPQNSMFYRLRLGEMAPIDGFLFSDPAAAFMVTEYEATVQRYQLALSSQRARDYARLKLDTELLRLQLNTDRARFIVILRSYDFHIQDLQDIIEGQNSIFHNIVPIIAAGSVGIVVGFIVGIIVAN